MLQIIFMLVKQFELPILCIVGLDGLICCLVSDYLKKQNQKDPGSVPHCRQWVLGLSIFGLALMVIAMILLFVLGYYDQWLQLFF